MRKNSAYMRCVCTAVLLSATALANIGCAALIVGGAAAGGAAGYAYYKGNMTRDFTAPLDDANQATLTAIQEHRLAIVSHTVSTTGRKFSCTTSDGDQVKIYLEPIANGTRQPVTRVHVRVGWFGDRDLSEPLYNRIAAHLQKPVNAPPQLSGNPTAPTRLVPAAATAEPPLMTDAPSTKP